MSAANLIKCPSCEKKISIESKVCPACGKSFSDEASSKVFEQQKQDQKNQKTWCVILLIGILVFCAYNFVATGQTKNTASTNSKEVVVNRITDKSALFQGNIETLIVGEIPVTTASGQIMGSPERVGNDANILKIQPPSGENFFLLVRNNGKLIITDRFDSLRQVQNKYFIASTGGVKNETSHLISADGRILFSYNGSLENVSKTGRRLLVANYAGTDSNNRLLNNYKVLSLSGEVLYEQKMNTSFLVFATDDVLIKYGSGLKPELIFDITSGRRIEISPEDQKQYCGSYRGASGEVLVLFKGFFYEILANTIVRKPDQFEKIGHLTTVGEHMYRSYTKNNKHGYKTVDGKLVTEPIFDSMFTPAGSQDLTPPYVYFTFFMGSDGQVLANRIDSYEFGTKRFSEELAVVSFGVLVGEKNSTNKTTRVGFVNRNLDWVIPPIFSRATSFENGIAWVLKEGRWLAIRHPFASAGPQQLTSSLPVEPTPMKSFSNINKPQLEVRVITGVVEVPGTHHGGISASDGNDALSFEMVPEIGYRIMEVCPVASLCRVKAKVDTDTGLAQQIFSIELLVPPETKKTIASSKSIPTMQAPLQLNMPHPKPSFDCSKAVTNIEHAICSDVGLAQLDVALDNVYSIAKTKLNKKTLVAEQRTWIAGIKAECEKSSEINQCIRNQYAIRLQQLGNKVTSANKL